MSKPEDVTQEAWEAAVRCYATMPAHGVQMKHHRVAAIARAIMAAKAKEREAILQFEFDLPIHRNGADMMIAIREYIRKRGTP